MAASTTLRFLKPGTKILGGKDVSHPAVARKTESTKRLFCEAKCTDFMSTVMRDSGLQRTT